LKKAEDKEAFRFEAWVRVVWGYNEACQEWLEKVQLLLLLLAFD
jgi:hypothetical protein